MDERLIMKNLYFVARNSVLAALVFFAPVCPVSYQEWVAGNHVIVPYPFGIVVSIKLWVSENKGYSIAAASIFAYCAYREVTRLVRSAHEKKSHRIQSGNDDKEVDKSGKIVAAIKIVNS